jgi:IS30 family transposase
VASIAEGLEADIYFAHPYASWKPGVKENAKGLIRQYFHKLTDFNEMIDEEIET